jgi:glycosyltransferase involved in cell wall biosynthesis
MTSQVRVLHLIDSGGLYGAENVVMSLSSGLKKKGHHSVIGCFCYPNKDKPDVMKKSDSLGLENICFRLKNRFDLTAVSGIAAYCKTNNIKVIHSHGYKPSLFCMILRVLHRIPYVITCHLWYLRNARLRIYVFLEKSSMRFASRVVGVSEEIAGHLEKAGVDKHRLETISNGIDIPISPTDKPYDEPRLREELGLRNNSFVIGSLGRLTEQKDYGTLLLAAAKLLEERHDVEFIIAGDGELKADLVSLSQKLGIEDRFHFAGFRDDKENLLKLMDVFVLSSLDEGLPIAMLEAMAMRLPVIVTEVGGIPRVIRNGENGLLTDKGDYMRLKEKMLLLVADAGLRMALGSRAHDTIIREYSNERMTGQYLKMYAGVLTS